MANAAINSWSNSLAEENFTEITSLLDQPRLLPRQLASAVHKDFGSGASSN
jgi:hypothetical protein